MALTRGAVLHFQGDGVNSGCGSSPQTGIHSSGRDSMTDSQLGKLPSFPLYYRPPEIFLAAGAQSSLIGRECSMSLMFRVSLCALVLSLSLKSPVFPRVQFSSAVPDSFQSPAETAVRALVEKYFALYAAKDLDGLMNLWSRQAPDYTSFKQDLERRFTTEDDRFSLPTISRVKVEGEKVS